MVKFSCRLDHLITHNCAISATDDGVLETSKAALDTFSKMTVSLKQAQWHSSHFFKDDGVLETSVAALVAFSERTGSLEQAKQHSAVFYR